MAAEANVIHRALDDRRFRLAGALNLDQPFTSVVEVVIGGRVHELTAGPAGLGDDVAAASGVTRLDEELSYQGGRLRLGRARHYDGVTRLVEDVLCVVWQGARYCLVTHLYGGTAADALALLRTMRIVEHEDGVALTPSGGSFAGPATVIKQVPRLGLLELSPLTARHTRTLPSWQGVATRAGELFRDTLGDGSPYFVLAGRDTWATVLPLADTAVDDVPALADRLVLQTVG